MPGKDRLDMTNVPKECGLPSAKELTITETDATGLVKKMSAGDWKAEEVLVAFAKRVTIGHHIVRKRDLSICVSGLMSF